MCGIFGWSFKRRSRIPVGQREALASTLAIANSLRGDQSWGAYYQNHAGRSYVRREVGDIAAVPGISALGLWDVLMAHTRYATTGKVTKDNQHPFRAGSVLLAHNGVVFNHEELNTKYDRKCTVDSQHFAHHVAEGRDFSDIEAYGSVEWIDDSASRTVNLCRMRRGQLTVYGIKNYKGKQVGVAWSSDAEHLRSAIGAARLDAFPYTKLEEGHVYQVHGGKLYEHPKALKLACIEPKWDPKAWTTYRSTQTGGRGGRGTYTWREGSDGSFSFRNDGTGEVTTLAEWVERQQKRLEADGSDTEVAEDMIEVDQGLFADPVTGVIYDGQEPPAEPCETCGSTLGFAEDTGDCRECFTPREGGDRRIAEMTDEEWARYQARN